MTTLFWHDYETSGTDPRRDRPLQFAGLRTNLDLEPIDEPVVHYCKPPLDILPHPEACLITGITPQHAQQHGVIEAHFAQYLHEQFSQPQTCSTGYNVIRFDHEVTRHLFYRNFYDPYAHEWENQNSRWDLIDLVRMAYALRPQNIEWPLHENNTPSFRLSDLTRANHLGHQKAHDALSDVEATIDLARLIKEQQPKLYAFYFSLRNKNTASQYLDWHKHIPVLHVSSKFAAEKGCISIVMPIARLPEQPNAIAVYDLSVDPSELIMRDVETIQARLFTAQKDLPEGITRIPLKLVHLNRSPALAPLSTLQNVDLKRIKLNLEQCLKHQQQLLTCDGLAEKIRQVFAMPSEQINHTDAELSLYKNFIPNADRALSTKIRLSTPQELATQSWPLQDPRLKKLLFRYRARNWPASLSQDEQQSWTQWRRKNLSDESPLGTMSYTDFQQTIAHYRHNNQSTETQEKILNQLEDWGHVLLKDL